MKVYQSNDENTKYILKVKKHLKKNNLNFKNKLYLKICYVIRVK